MSSVTRIVAPGMPHHITHRGNRRMPTFFCDDDCRMYLALLSDFCARYHVDIWAYCLMPCGIQGTRYSIARQRFRVNRIAPQLSTCPQNSGYADGLRGALGEMHRRYTRYINFREDWRGHLWQEGWNSGDMLPNCETAISYEQCSNAIEYRSPEFHIELNTVRAGLVAQAEEYAWSSARAHLSGTSDLLVNVAPLCSEISDWAAFLGLDEEETVLEQMHSCQRTGRPCGDMHFILEVESLCGRILHRQKPGRKGKSDVK